MPFKKGEKRHPAAGRKKGSQNKVDKTIQDRIAQNSKRHPMDTVLLIQDQSLPCGVCLGTGKTKYQPKYKAKKPTTAEEMADWAEAMEEPDTKAKERVCQSCWGSGVERHDPKVVLSAADIALKFSYSLPPRQLDVSAAVVNVQAQSAADAIKQARALKMAQSDAKHN